MPKPNEADIPLRCACGNRDSDTVYLPLCSAECGGRMFLDLDVLADGRKSRPTNTLVLALLGAILEAGDAANPHSAPIAGNEGISAASKDECVAGYLTRAARYLRLAGERTVEERRE